MGELEPRVLPRTKLSIEELLLGTLPTPLCDTSLTYLRTKLVCAAPFTIFEEF